MAPVEQRAGQRLRLRTRSAVRPAPVSAARADHAIQRVRRRVRAPPAAPAWRGLDLPPRPRAHQGAGQRTRRITRPHAGAVQRSQHAAPQQRRRRALPPGRRQRRARHDCLVVRRAPPAGWQHDAAQLGLSQSAGHQLHDGHRARHGRPGTQRQRAGRQPGRLPGRDAPCRQRRRRPLAPGPAAHEPARARHQVLSWRGHRARPARRRVVHAQRPSRDRHTPGRRTRLRHHRIAGRG